METDNIFRSSTLEVLMTNKCNFRCKYCFLGNEHIGPEADLDFVKKYLEANGCREFYTFGGEPLVNAVGIAELVDFVESSSSIKHKEDILKSMKLVTTNGSLIKNNLGLIKKYGLRFQISLDGDREGNSQRVYADGREVFDDVMEAVKICRENNIEYSTHGVINLVNASRYAEIIKFFFEEGLDKTQSVNQTIDIFNHNFSMMVIEEEFTDEFIDLFLKQLEKTTKWILRLPLNSEQKHNLFDGVVARKVTYGVCGAATGLKVADEIGGMYPCHRTHGTQSLNLGSFLDAEHLQNIAAYNAWSDLRKSGFMYSSDIKLDSRKDSIAPWVYWCPATNNELGDIAYISPKYIVLNKEIASFTNYLIEKYNVYK